MSRKPRPSPCIVCHSTTIILDAAKNHPYGAGWENRCCECMSDQTEDAWFAHLYEMPGDRSITLQCPFVCFGRCPQMHTFPLGDLLTHTPAAAQFRCTECGDFGTGMELLLSNKEVLKQLVGEYLVGEERKQTCQ